MQITLDSTTLKNVLHHAASAARIASRVDGNFEIEPLADHVDAIVHLVSELLGTPQALAASVSSAAAPSETVVRGDAHGSRLEAPDTSGGAA